jgi:hypothetical protein
VAVQAVRERPQEPLARPLYPVTETVAGFGGARVVTGATGTASSGSYAWTSNVETHAWTSNAMIGVMFGGVYYASAGEYDPDFVASILQADAAPPEASFNNVVDMLDWLNRD